MGGAAAQQQPITRVRPPENTAKIQGTAGIGRGSRLQQQAAQPGCNTGHHRMQSLTSRACIRSESAAKLRSSWSKPPGGRVCLLREFPDPVAAACDPPTCLHNRRVGQFYGVLGPGTRSTRNSPTVSLAIRSSRTWPLRSLIRPRASWPTASLPMATAPTASAPSATAPKASAATATAPSRLAVVDRRRAGSNASAGPLAAPVSSLLIAPSRYSRQRSPSRRPCGPHQDGQIATRAGDACERVILSRAGRLTTRR
jgi:hypothetical protein